MTVYLVGRFFRADTPVPEGFDFYDVPTEHTTYAIYTSEDFNGDRWEAYYDRILSNGVCIPYPQRYWHT